MSQAPDTIADKLREWSRGLLAHAAIAGHTEAHNAVLLALDDLCSRDWTQAPVPTNQTRSAPDRAKPPLATKEMS